MRLERDYQLSDLVPDGTQPRQLQRVIGCRSETTPLILEHGLNTFLDISYVNTLIDTILKDNCGVFSEVNEKEERRGCVCVPDEGHKGGEETRVLFFPRASRIVKGLLAGIGGIARQGVWMFVGVDACWATRPFSRLPTLERWAPYRQPSYPLAARGTATIISSHKRCTHHTLARDAADVRTPDG